MRFPTKKLHKLSARYLVVFVGAAARAEMRGRKRKEKKHLRRLCVQAPEIFSQYPIGRDVRASAQEHLVGLDLRARHLGELFEQV